MKRGSLFYISLILLFGMSAVSCKPERRNIITVTETEFDAAVENQANRRFMEGFPIYPEEMPGFRRKVLNNLINDQILLHLIEDYGFSITEDKVNTQLEIIESNEFKSREEFMTLLNERDLSYEEFKQDLRTLLTIDAFKHQYIYSEVIIPDDEVDKYYYDNPAVFIYPETVVASHILVKVDPAASADERKNAHKRIIEALGKVKSGDDFAEIAFKYSEDSSAEHGGYLGPFWRGHMLKPFEDAAFALKAGEFSGIVETEFGYHIIFVSDHSEEKKAELETIRESLREELVLQKHEEMFESYITVKRRDFVLDIPETE